MRRRDRRKDRLLWLFAAAFFFSSALLVANPEGLQIISGKAIRSASSGTNLLELTSKDRTILHWKDFSIKEGEITRFLQPNSSSSILNRVTGTLRSRILGKLESNGKVFLINPNGILIGNNARIHVGSFFASTLDFSDTSFLQGEDLLCEGASKASLYNQGKIRADDGDIFLIGFQVFNSGELSAPKGTVAMAAGLSVLIRPHGNQRIFIRPQLKPPAKECRGLEHSGTIEALQTELKADGNLYVHAIRSTGSIDALSVEKRGGRVYLVADKGDIEISGRIRSGEIIDIEGKKIEVFNQAILDASSQKKGGDIFIRGEKISVDNTSLLSSNALQDGTGGKILLSGEKETQVFGTIEAKGGSESGSGGWVGLEAKELLFASGKVDTSSRQGKCGTLELIAPHFLLASQEQLDSSRLSDHIYSPLAIADLFTFLLSNSVTINASKLSSLGTIRLINNVIWDSPTILSLLAAKSIFLDGGLYSLYPHFTPETETILLKAPDIKLNLTAGQKRDNIFMEAASGNIRVHAPSRISYYVTPDMIESPPQKPPPPPEASSKPLPEMFQNESPSQDLTATEPNPIEQPPLKEFLENKLPQDEIAATEDVSENLPEMIEGELPSQDLAAAEPTSIDQPPLDEFLENTFPQDEIAATEDANDNLPELLESELPSQDLAATEPPSIGQPPLDELLENTFPQDEIAATEDVSENLPEMMEGEPPSQDLAATEPTSIDQPPLDEFLENKLPQDEIAATEDVSENLPEMMEGELPSQDLAASEPPSIDQPPLDELLENTFPQDEIAATEDVNDNLPELLESEPPSQDLAATETHSLEGKGEIAGMLKIKTLEEVSSAALVSMGDIPFEAGIPHILYAPTFTEWLENSDLLTSKLFFDAQPYGNHLNLRQEFKIGFQQSLPASLYTSRALPLSEDLQRKHLAKEERTP